MAAIDGAVLITIGAAGLGYLSYKAFADVANRPVDHVYSRKEQQYLKQMVMIQRSNTIADGDKKVQIKELKGKLADVAKRRQVNATGGKALAQWTGLAVFAFPLLAPVYLCKWGAEKFTTATTAEQRKSLKKDIKGRRRRYTEDEVLERARARWENI